MVGDWVFHMGGDVPGQVADAAALTRQLSHSERDVSDYELLARIHPLANCFVLVPTVQIV